MIVELLAPVLLMAAAAPTIEVSSGDWSNIPAMPSKSNFLLGTAAMKGIDRAVAEGKCPQAGSKRHIRLDVPVLVQFGEGAAVQRVVVRKIGCPEVEEIVGNVALQSAQAGRFAPSGINRAGWYRSAVSYTSDF